VLESDQFGINFQNIFHLIINIFAQNQCLKLI
jgi:hypothetical protein